MAELYVTFYDTENRLRWFIAQAMEKHYGSVWSDPPNIPRKTRDSIDHERGRLRLHVAETRSAYLDFSNFSDLASIIEARWTEVFQRFFPNDAKTGLPHIMVWLNYLTEARNYVAHNTLLNREERLKIKEFATILRNLIIEATDKLAP